MLSPILSNYTHLRYPRLKKRSNTKKNWVITDQFYYIQGELLQGTLDLLILKTLGVGAAHGHTIAYAIERRSEDVLQV